MRTRRVRLVRGVGRGVSDQYGGRGGGEKNLCPVVWGGSGEAGTGRVARLRSGVFVRGTWVLDYIPRCARRLARS
jgi:hypothetical protein